MRRMQHTMWLLLVFFASQVLATTDLSDKKLLYVDSYHADYGWSTGIEQGIRQVLEPTGIDIKVARMDTKRNRDEAFKLQAALDVKALIESYQPDVVIASDDNASKYLIKPYYKDAEIPFVFCGVNWDASVYGFPYKNVTGMEEINLIQPLLKQLSRYAKGQRLGVLSMDAYSEKRVIGIYKDQFSIQFDKEVYVNTFEEWKQAYTKLQQQVDQLLLVSPKGIQGWDNDLAVDFVLENTDIPSGTVQQWMMSFTTMGFVKVPQEQGEWAAQAALKILAGQSPSEIPIEQNKKGKLVINLKISNSIGLIFHNAILKNAEVIR
ncbi:ABC transporter substrate binding protein [Candidatus Albibeggiatoa sp. nov. NOAA]|uniref:ABC transporter substrate-binding protein n=1 Tax=Candidatus Albibeggiatoa sp. nov. NOAA TaxID=3162724 RepID=UPI0032FAF1AC|nr:ABC transporter substrate-binding protein [Thiotrichaceae bacterium]